MSQPSRATPAAGPAEGGVEHVGGDQARAHDVTSRSSRSRLILPSSALVTASSVTGSLREPLLQDRQQLGPAPAGRAHQVDPAEPLLVRAVAVGQRGGELPASPASTPDCSRRDCSPAGRRSARHRSSDGRRARRRGRRASSWPSDVVSRSDHLAPRSRTGGRRPSRPPSAVRRTRWSSTRLASASLRRLCSARSTHRYCQTDGSVRPVQVRAHAAASSVGLPRTSPCRCVPSGSASTITLLLPIRSDQRDLRPGRRERDLAVARGPAGTRPAARHRGLLQ